MTPMKAIRAKCLDCNYTAQEVKLCPCTTCPLWPFRLGKNPNINKRVLTDDQRKAASDRLKIAREKRKSND
jgi:hypothetical protein